MHPKGWMPCCFRNPNSPRRKKRFGLTCTYRPPHLGWWPPCRVKELVKLRSEIRKSLGKGRGRGGVGKLAKTERLRGSGRICWPPLPSEPSSRMPCIPETWEKGNTSLLLRQELLLPCQPALNSRLQNYSRHTNVKYPPPPNVTISPKENLHVGSHLYYHR